MFKIFKIDITGSIMVVVSRAILPPNISKNAMPF